MADRTDPRRRIARLRLRNQRLAGPLTGASALRTAADVVAWMGAVQAQEYPYARWSVGQRANGVLDEAAVEAALARGDIVRTHVMRDTWHFVTRSDARWLLRLTGPRIQARNGTQYRKLGLDSAQLAKTDALLADVLSGGVQLTRRALAGELAQRGLIADGPRLAYILMHAELEEVICRSTVIGGRTYWSANDGGTASRRVTPRAHLLQVYDEYVVAYRESRDLLDIDHLAARLPGGQVMFLHAIILDGQFIGHWRRQVTKTALVVETQLARPLSNAEATAVEEAIARHGAFVGLPTDWVRTDT